MRFNFRIGLESEDVGIVVKEENGVMTDIVEDSSVEEVVVARIGVEEEIVVVVQVLVGE